MTKKEVFLFKCLNSQKWSIRSRSEHQAGPNQLTQRYSIQTNQVQSVFRLPQSVSRQGGGITDMVGLGVGFWVLGNPTLPTIIYIFYFYIYKYTIFCQQPLGFHKFRFAFQSFSLHLSHKWHRCKHLTSPLSPSNHQPILGFQSLSPLSLSRPQIINRLAKYFLHSFHLQFFIIKSVRPPKGADYQSKQVLYSA